MASSQGDRGMAARLLLAAALTLAGAGAGVAAVLATSDSGLIRATGGAAGGAAGLGAAVWADTAKHRRETAAAARRERDRVLDPVISEPAHDRSVLGLLLATRQSAAPFRSRTADLAWLQTWCDNPGSHPVALVTGPAGVGKTRLATQFATTRPAPWATGWLHPRTGTTALNAIRACPDPALILIDDADTSPDAPALLASMAGTTGPTRVRVLLLTRSAEALAQAARQLPEMSRWIIAPANLPVHLISPFGSAADHARWFGEAARAYAAARHTPPPDLPEATATADTTSADEPMLAVQAKALLAVLDTERRRPGQPVAQALPFDRVAEALFDHEQRRWEQTAQQPGRGLTDLAAVVQQRAIATLMLASAASEDQAITALQVIPDLADAPAERLARIARWAFDLYPPGPVRLQPAMLAEWFLITQLTTAPSLARHLPGLARPHLPALLILLAHASDHMPAGILLFARLIKTDPASLAAPGADAALTASTAQPLLDAALAEQVTATHWSPGALTELNRHLLEGTLPRTRAAVSAVLVDHARETGTREDLANALNSYGLSLSELGRHRDALATLEDALALWRPLAAANPAHKPNLARALDSYGTSLRDLGRHADALAAKRKALALLQRLAAANPADEPDLAHTLGCYGASLSIRGRHWGALAAQKEALALWRRLAAANPAHQPDLADTLGCYGASLRNLGQQSEALAYDREALELYARLADSYPDLYEKTYQHHLSQLRRTYDLQGNHAASINLLLRRHTKNNDQTSKSSATAGK